MSIRLPLLVFFSFLLCPVASQTGQHVKRVTSGRCTGAELIGTTADCQAAATTLGLAGTYVVRAGGGWTNIRTGRLAGAPQGCVWVRGYQTASPHSGYLWFNTDKRFTYACGDGTSTYMCLCVDPCPIGNYQNEESMCTSCAVMNDIASVVDGSCTTCDGSTADTCSAGLFVLVVANWTGVDT